MERVGHSSASIARRLAISAALVSAAIVSIGGSLPIRPCLTAWARGCEV